MTPRKLALLVTAFVVAAETQARADEVVAKENDTRAEQLFQLAEKKFDSGRFVEACSDWELSLRLSPKLGTLLNLALCHETIGRIATAWSEFQHAGAWATQNGQRDRHDFALNHALALENRLPRVVFQFPIDRAFASVEIDGEPVPVPKVFLPQYLDPGEHTIAVTAPGKKRSSTSFRVVAAGSDQIVVVPSLEDDRPKPFAPSPPRILVEDHPTRRTVGWVLLGIGAAGALSGGFGGVLAVDRKDDTGTRLAAIGIGAGILTLATGTVLVVTSKTTKIALSPAGAFGSF